MERTYVCPSFEGAKDDSREVPFPTQAGQVGGHEGVGIVHKLGPGSENGRVKVGDRVGIKVEFSVSILGI